MVEKVILSVAGCCFGIYIIHIIIRDLDEKVGIYNSLIRHGVEGLLAAFLFSAVIFVISYVVIFAVRLIPGMKKLI